MTEEEHKNSLQSCKKSRVEEEAAMFA